MTFKLLVTGASGFVAGNLLAQASPEWQICAVSRAPSPKLPPNIRWLSADLSEPGAAAAIIGGFRPDAVVHTAAIPDIDYCQAHRDEALRVNTGLTREVAHAAAGSGIRLVHCSTDNVFDGAKGMYAEGDPVGPVNFYGETKVLAEEAVRASQENAVVARVAIVMGLPQPGTKGAFFLTRMAKSIREGRPVETPANEIRTPVDAVSLGRALLELAANTFTGTMHLSGSERLNRVEMMRKICARLGFSPDLVRANDPTTIPGRADRPLDVSLDNRLASAVLDTPLPGVLEGLELVLAENGGTLEQKT